MDNNNSDKKRQPRRRLLKSWITPVIISVALPIHADTTAVAPEPNILHRDLNLGLQIQSCTGLIITVRICNNEPFDVQIHGASVEQYPPRTGSLYLVLKTVSHNTPFLVPAGECTTASFSRQTSRGYWCGPPWRLLVGGQSQGAYGEHELVTGVAYAPLGGGAATSTPFTIQN